MTPLRLEHVVKRFGGIQAVGNVNLEAADGERVVIIGPNGAGKTTLFGLISGDFSPTRGRVFLQGRDVTRVQPHRRVALGLGRTYQVTNLLPRLTVLENILLAAAALRPVRYVPFRPLRRYTDLYAHAQALLDPLGLWARRDDAVRELSHGEQRQLEVAMALASSPKVLLLDEPTSGLSAAETRIVLELLRRLPRTITMVMIEHDMDVAFSVADRMVVMSQGEIVAEGTPGEVRANQRVREIYLGTA